MYEYVHVCMSHSPTLSEFSDPAPPCRVRSFLLLEEAASCGLTSYACVKLDCECVCVCVCVRERERDHGLLNRAQGWRWH